MLAQLLLGDHVVAWMAIVLLVAAGTLEAMATTRRWRWFFRVGFPLGTSVVPLPHPPKGAGAGGGVGWAPLADAQRVAFWSDARSGLFPRGVHGVVSLRADRAGRVHLDVTWAPWWTPLVGCGWLSVLGASRGDAWFAVPIAMMLTGVLLFVYHHAALGVVRALRFAWAEQPPHSQGGRPS